MIPDPYFVAHHLEKTTEDTIQKKIEDTISGLEIFNLFVDYAGHYIFMLIRKQRFQIFMTHGNKNGH